MKTGHIAYPLSAQLKDNARVHGEQDAARMLSKKVDFLTYFMLRFGKMPKV